MGTDNCIFCKIANGVIPSETIFENQQYRVILDLSPVSKGHALIIPKTHCQDLCDASEEVLQGVLPLAKMIGNAYKEALGATGFNIVQNNGKSAGQTVFHLHIHVVPRYGEGDGEVVWRSQKAPEGQLEEVAYVIRNYFMNSK